MDVTMEAVRLGLDVAQLRAQIASANIAHANVASASFRRGNFADALATLKVAARDPERAAESLTAITPQTLQADVYSTTVTAGAASLDDQVAELSTQGVVYRALTDGLSRRFALMQLAIAGK